MSDITYYQGYQEEPWYIAICEHGYGVSQDPAKAILSAQESVPAKAKESPLYIYRHNEEIEPTGFITWPNSVVPKGRKRAKIEIVHKREPTLVACITTHQAWKRRHR
jgi:hypothetical protein